jgi:hypothetical protein
MSARQQLHGQRRAAQGLAQIGEVSALRHPGLVGQHRETRVVKATDPTHLDVVAAGQDHHVAGSVGAETVERLRSHADDWPPARRALGSRVEGGHQAQELPDLGFLVGVDDDVVADEWVSLPQGERGMEVPGRQKAHRMHERHGKAGGVEKL